MHKLVMYMFCHEKLNQYCYMLWSVIVAKVNQSFKMMFDFDRNIFTFTL